MAIAVELGSSHRASFDLCKLHSRFLAALIARFVLSNAHNGAAESHLPDSLMPLYEHDNGWEISFLRLVIAFDALLLFLIAT